MVQEVTFMKPSHILVSEKACQASVDPRWWFRPQTWSGGAYPTCKLAFLVAEPSKASAPLLPFAPVWRTPVTSRRSASRPVSLQYRYGQSRRGRSMNRRTTRPPECPELMLWTVSSSSATHLQTSGNRLSFESAAIPSSCSTPWRLRSVIYRAILIIKCRVRSICSVPTKRR